MFCFGKIRPTGKLHALLWFKEEKCSDANEIIACRAEDILPGKSKTHAEGHSMKTDIEMAHLLPLVFLAT